MAGDLTLQHRHASPTSGSSGWLRQLLRKPKHSSSSDAVPKQSPPSSSSSVTTASPSASHSTASPGQGPSASQLSISSPGSARWAKSYDVCICHSAKDLQFVEEMVSYLENAPEGIRCFLQLRDSMPGSPITTELCEAVQGSHCWVMVITPNFLEDPWCRYQMHQALAESPMANGRTIPVLKDIDRRDYPRELRCLYYISVTLKENGFRQIKATILRYLQELCRSTASGI
ncbi:toll/interleukin-1 receptor domain-containing adapter protein isoform X2 [Emydura macquarii macquarii]|uniref:toll/interleukin-1 receptor domain-containing adapter protein isoform X2 n=1 Tax=Emydura macquarii macquarii TaxID=1129001 RepID=UPI00352B0186